MNISQNVIGICLYADFKIFQVVFCLWWATQNHQHCLLTMGMTVLKPRARQGVRPEGNSPPPSALLQQIHSRHRPQVHFPSSPARLGGDPTKPNLDRPLQHLQGGNNALETLGYGCKSGKPITCH